MNVEVAGFTFLSDFDSGNLGRVELVARKTDVATDAESISNEEIPDFEFNVWTRPDCVGTEYENGNRTWFHFGVKGGTPFANVQLNIVDLNKQTKMYSQGMAPVYRVVPGRNHWERVKDKPHFRMKDNVFILTFRYRTLENTRATTYFAFTYPFPYIELENMLQSIDNRFKHQNDKVRKSSDLDDIYYHRECVCYSLEGRRVELITISSHHHITKDREPRLKYLFPDTKHPRPFCFGHKKVVFVSARVHPGETPSSFVLNGFLHLLLKREDPIAILLRKNYIFKLVPMLNPDGVSRGHYRTDTRGVNLNRVYLSPSFALHPPIYAARALILYYHHGKEIEEVVTGPIFDPAARRYKLRTNSITTESESVEVSDAPSPGFNIQCKSVTRYLNPKYHNDSGKTSNIENQVQSLSLSDRENISNNDCNRQSSFLGHSSKESDVLSTICESFIKKVFDISELEEKTFNVVGGSTYETRPHGSKSCSAVDPLQELRHGGEGGGDSLFAQRSETSLSIGSIQSSVSSGGCAKRNFTSNNKQKNERSGEKRFSSANRISQNSAESVENCTFPPDPDPDATKTVYTSPEHSGLFLYVDLHGHASKKGIFMYGNHFDNIMDSVDCMLLPKIMSLNSPNFHFSACNFTEKNMYLRDRKDGSSREGCGRVSVLKATGLIRSYTLECNYNTGRLVNILPPCVRDMHKPNTNTLVPPKYTPLVFEEIGHALGASILDLSGTHPWSRVPNSEFRTLTGIREWLKGNCVSEQLFLQKSLPQNHKNLSARRQVVCVTGASLRMSRPSRSTASTCKGTRLVPLASKASKIAGCSNVAAHGSADKSQDGALGSVLDSERKENVTSFHIISPPQSPDLLKINKDVSDPKENVSPCSSQKFSVTSKKLKAATTVGVLKQVLAVRSKCTSMSSASSSSKSRGNPAFKIYKSPPASSSNLHKNSKVHYDHQASDVLMCSDVTSHCAGTHLVVGSDSEGADREPSAGKIVCNDKTKYVKDELKGVVKHGPKRLKVSTLKSDQQAVGPTLNRNGSGQNKITLKEICYLNTSKEKKNFSSFAIVAEMPLEKIKSSLGGDVWNVEHKAGTSLVRTARQNPLRMRGNSIQKDEVHNLAKDSSTSVAKNKTNTTGASNGPKLKSGFKSEKFIKTKVSHMSPVKTLKKSPPLGRKASGDVGKKWGKSSLRNFATSVGKLRVAVKEDTACLEKKRKKSKLKY